ncbi:MAG: GTPase Era [Pseudomonadota bacterium]
MLADTISHNSNNIDKNLQKSISITIVGRPNTGKSTLFNKILNKNLSTITHKRQTTQNIFNGIKTIDNTQIIMWDTPGIFNQSSKENRFVKLAWHTLYASDIIFIMISAVFKHDLKIEKQIIDNIAKNNNHNSHKQKIIICINKIDLTPNRIDELKMIFKNYDILTICALKNSSKDAILNKCIENAYLKPWLYDSNTITNLDNESITNEITRKQILLNIHEEIPYSTIVENTSLKENKDNIIIHQEIIAKHARHKGIIIGKKAKTIKNINIRARREMEALFDKKIHLFINVKSL